MEILDETKSPPQFQWYLTTQMNEDDIILRCPKCKRTQLERKWSNDPKNAKFCESLCPKCDNGDFYTEVFYDQDNKVIETNER